jgi:hypothetical protein
MRRRAMKSELSSFFLSRDKSQDEEDEGRRGRSWDALRGLLTTESPMRATRECARGRLVQRGSVGDGRVKDGARRVKYDAQTLACLVAERRYTLLNITKLRKQSHPSHYYRLLFPFYLKSSPPRVISDIRACIRHLPFKYRQRILSTIQHNTHNTTSRQESCLVLAARHL